VDIDLYRVTCTILFPSEEEYVDIELYQRLSIVSYYYSYPPGKIHKNIIEPFFQCYGREEKDTFCKEFSHISCYIGIVIRNVKSRWKFGCTSRVKEPDIFGNICEYLSPRDLLHVSILNQTCRHLIASDLRLVIFVGLFHGGRAKRLLQNLYKQMLLEAIYIPNALRLLRIINGLRCEFCNQNKVHFSRPQFPIFACWFCLHRGKHNSFGATEEITKQSE